MINEITAFMNAADEFLDLLTPKFSFNTFLEFLSDYYDEKILEQIQDNNACKYIGGFCNLYVEGEVLKVDTELYFEMNGSYDKHILNGAVPINRFFKDTQDKEIQEIVRLESKKIDIDAPV